MLVYFDVNENKQKYLESKICVKINSKIRTDPTRVTVAAESNVNVFCDVFQDESKYDNLGHQPKTLLLLLNLFATASRLAPLALTLIPRRKEALFMRNDVTSPLLAFVAAERSGENF